MKARCRLSSASRTRCARSRPARSAAWRSPTTRTSARATSSSASTSRPLPARYDEVSDPLGLTPFPRVGAMVSDPEGPTPSMANRRSEKTTGPSQRQLRVAELIRHALAEMLARSEIHDDVLAAHVVTIPEVRMSPDLRLATIYVTTLGGEDLAPVLAALDTNRKYIRS